MADRYDGRQVAEALTPHLETCLRWLRDGKIPFFNLFASRGKRGPY